MWEMGAPHPNCNFRCTTQVFLRVNGVKSICYTINPVSIDCKNFQFNINYSSRFRQLV